MLYGALRLWPFEDNAVFHWMRWAGKTSIKWSFIGIVFALIVFVIVQLLNAAWLTKTLKGKDRSRG